MNISFVPGASIPNFFFVTLHASGVLQETTMKSYSPGHECSSLKRQLCWNKS